MKLNEDRLTLQPACSGHFRYYGVFFSASVFLISFAFNIELCQHLSTVSLYCKLFQFSGPTHINDVLLAHGYNQDTFTTFKHILNNTSKESRLVSDDNEREIPWQFKTISY